MPREQGHARAVPEPQAGVGAADDPQIVRSYYIDGPAAEKIVTRARGLRERAGTLSGHALGEDFLAAELLRANVLDDVLAVFGPGEDRLWSEVIVAKLSEHRPDSYREWTPAALATALRPYGLTPAQAPAVDETTGTGRTPNR